MKPFLKKKLNLCSLPSASQGGRRVDATTDAEAFSPPLALLPEEKER